MNTQTAARLEAYERRYKALAAQLANIGYIASGSLASRPSRCGKPDCSCHADPPRLHGPYWHLTSSVNGKTVNRRFSPARARLYNQWIANDRRLRDLIAQMRAVAAKAEELLLKEQAGQ